MLFDLFDIVIWSVFWFGAMFLFFRRSKEPNKSFKIILFSIVGIVATVVLNFIYLKFGLLVTAIAFLIVLAIYFIPKIIKSSKSSGF